MNRKGFTLIELLATIVILGIVGGIATYGVINTINTSKLKSEKIFVDKLSNLIDDYLDLYSSELTKDNSLRPATVITKYVDIDTNGEIAEQTVEKGHQGDEYITAAKTIEYYKITKLPDNSTGIMDGTIEVIYYYRKLTFDLEIDKTINSLKINGKSKKITDEELVKAEVYRKEVDSTKIEVVYKITVRNKGEIAGKAVILEKIPENMKMNKSKNTGWEIDGKEARIETKEIAPGGSATYKVTLEWVKGDGNFGTIRNVAKLEKVENTPNYEEKDLSNNSDDADVIVTVSTGIEKVSMIAIIALIYILSAVYVNKRLDFAKVRIESDEKSDK